VFPNLSGFILESTAYPYGEADWESGTAEFAHGHLFNPQITMYVKSAWGNDTDIIIRSFPSGDVVNSFAYPQSAGPYRFSVLGLTTDNRVILGESGAVYTISIDGTDMRKLADVHDNDIYNVSLSPDGKHLAYRTLHRNLLLNKNTPYGVYILNIETGTAVFYEVYPAGSAAGEFNIVGWANKDGVDALIMGR